MNIEIANRLATLRKHSGLSQEQLADKLGLSRQAISKWERAESSPDTDNLIALAKLYQVSLDELLKMDPEAADDELFARLSERAAQGEKAEGKAALLGGRRLKVDREKVFESKKNAKKRARNEKKHRRARMEKVAPEVGPVWRFQRADGSVDLRMVPYPIVVTLIFLLIGALFDLWHPGWMLFLTIPIYYTALGPEGGFDLNRIPFALLVSILYLVAGFAWDLWHPGWIIFFTIPLYYTMAGKLMKDRANQALIAVMVLGVFYLIGASLGHWFRIWLVGPVLALIVAGVLKNRGTQS